mgnify:CR=1 FL=1
MSLKATESQIEKIGREVGQSEIKNLRQKRLYRVGGNMRVVMNRSQFEPLVWPEKRPIR